MLGLLQYTGLPQGVKNAAGTFQRVIDVILGDRKGKDVLTFLDDENIGIETEEEHLKSLDEVLNELHEAGVRQKLSKCRFGVRQVKVLKHQVGPQGVTPAAGHLWAIQILQEPASGE